MFFERGHASANEGLDADGLYAYTETRPTTSGKVSD